MPSADLTHPTQRRESQDASAAGHRVPGFRVSLNPGYTSLNPSCPRKRASGKPQYGIVRSPPSGTSFADDDKHGASRAMVAEDFLRDPLVRQWLGGIEPAWALLTLESLRALRQEPSAVQRAIRIANDIDSDEVAASPMARNTLILLRHAIEREGLALTATGNLTRAAVAEMRGLIEWPDYDQAEAFQFNKVINEADFLPLHVVRQLAQAAALVRARRGKLVTTRLGRSMISGAPQRSLLAILFHLAFWRMDLGYF